MAAVYIEVTFTKSGNIKAVRKDGKVARKRKPKPGEKPKVVGVVTLELLKHESKKKGGARGKKEGKKKEKPEGTDPCCFRDPRTGNVWCWC